MTELATAAWVAHDIGTAVGVGGSLFGKIALEPSVRNISDRADRGRVVNDAWRRFGSVQMAAYGLMAASWLAGRLKLGGRAVNAASGPLVVAKDVLVGATLASAVGAAVAGRKMSQQRMEGAVPMNGQGDPASDAPPAARRLKGITDAFGLVSLVAGLGVVAVTTVLAMQAGKSGRWKAVSRLLP
jgi:uncharacterized membrane protein